MKGTVEDYARYRSDRNATLANGRFVCVDALGINLNRGNPSVAGR